MTGGVQLFVPAAVSDPFAYGVRPMALARPLTVVVAAAASFFLAVPGAAPARAAGAEGGGGRAITVTGSGEAKARPTVVEMNAVVSGEAELAADAVVKYK